MRLGRYQNRLAGGAVAIAVAALFAMAMISSNAADEAQTVGPGTSAAREIGDANTRANVEPSPDNSGGGTPIDNELLVKFDPDLDDATARSLIEDNGGEVVAVIPSIEVYLVLFADVSPSLDDRIESFEELDGVIYAEKNHVGGGAGIYPNDPGVTAGRRGQWHLDAINAPDAWEMTRGSATVRAAILDTGWLPDNPEFHGSRFVAGPDVVNGDSDPTADHPHGVWTLGLMAANAYNGFAGVGIDHNMSVEVVKTLDADNSSTDAELAAGIVAAADSEPRPTVMSLSLINFTNNNTTRGAVQYARDRGIIIISCAGNGGIGNADTQFPSNTDLTISIGATDADNRRASFSGTGSHLEFMAPGADVLGMRWRGNGGQQKLNGCSFATPIATGIAGLMLSIDPTLTQDELRQAWQATARDQVGDNTDLPGWDSHYGYGLLDAAAAVTYVRDRRADPDPPGPTTTVQPPTTQASPATTPAPAPGPSTSGAPPAPTTTTSPPAGPTTTTTAPPPQSSGALVSVGNGLCVAVSSGFDVTQESCSGAAIQAWSLVSLGPEVVQVVNTATGKCLDVHSGGTANGTRVGEWSCHSGGSQQWEARSVGSGLWLVNPQSGKCLDVPGGSSAPGTRLLIWTCHGGTNQQWLATG